MLPHNKLIKQKLKILQKFISARINYCAPYLCAEFLVLNTAQFCPCAQYCAVFSTRKI